MFKRVINACYAFAIHSKILYYHSASHYISNISQNRITVQQTVIRFSFSDLFGFIGSSITGILAVDDLCLFCEFLCLFRGTLKHSN